MAYQFIHVSTYSIKTGGKGVAAEAGRKPNHSKHVENPLPPVHLFGMSTDDAWTEIERRKESATNSLVDKKGITRLRKLRSDQLVMLAAVASWPVSTNEQDPEDPEFKKWIQDTLDFLGEKHGKALSAVLHLDETHPHIHYITAPDLEAGERMHDIHSGEKAKKDLGGRQAGAIDKRRAFKDAMRGYQDDYHSNVSVRYAQARLGPQRLRYSRDQYQALKVENKRVANQIMVMEQREKDLDSRSQKIDKRGSALKAEIASSTTLLLAEKNKIYSLQEKTSRVQKVLEIRESSLEKQEKSVGEREEKAENIIRKNASFYDRALSVATFGQKGLAKEIKNARENARKESQVKIEELNKKLLKTKKLTDISRRKLDDSEAYVKSQKTLIKANESEVQDLKNEVLGMQELLSDERRSVLLLKGDRSTVEKNYRIISANIDLLKASLNDLDIDKAKKVVFDIDSRIKVMTKLENPKSSKESKEANKQFSRDNVSHP